MAIPMFGIDPDNLKDTNTMTLRTRLLEPIIMEAVADGRITDTELAKRLVHERAEAAKEIQRLAGVLSEIKDRAEKQPDFDIGDAWFMAREALQGME